METMEEKEAIFVGRSKVCSGNEWLISEKNSSMETSEKEVWSFLKISFERNRLLEAPKEENEFKVRSGKEKVIPEGKVIMEKTKEEVPQF